MKKKFLQLFEVCCLFITISISPAQASNYYWRAVAVNNLFTNVGNWETSPGGGVSPSVAPGVNDDVFFPVASNFNNINFNSGNCRNFSSNAASPASFTFTGTLTALAGSVDFSGATATLNFLNGADINFTGALSSHTLNFGNAIVQGGNLNFNGAGTGTYTLTAPLNTNAVIAISGQSFNTAGYDFSFTNLAVTGSTVKTINFSNSKVTEKKTTALRGNMQLNSSHTTTTYNFTGTRLYIENTATVSNQVLPAIALDYGVQVTMDSVILNAGAGAMNNYDMISIPSSSSVQTKLSISVLKLNTNKLILGLPNESAGNPNTTDFTIGQLYYVRPGTAITVGDRMRMNIGAIIPPSGCGQNTIMTTGGFPLNINATVPISTGNIGFYGITFSGSAYNAGSSDNDLGLNSGTVTWSGAGSGINFWWVGGTGNWNDPTKWSIVGSGGAPQSASGCLPTVKDNVYFDAASFSGTQTVTMPSGIDAYCKNLDWSAGSNQGLLTAIVTTGRNNLYVNGSADFSKARGVETDLVFIGTGTHTITSGTFFTYNNNFVRLAGTGTYTLADNFTGNPSTSYFQHRAGSFNTNGKTLDVMEFISYSFPVSTANLRNLDITNSIINIRDKIGNAGAGPNNIDLYLMNSLNASNSTFNMYAAVGPYFGVTKSVNASPSLSAVTLNNINFLSPALAYFVAAAGSGAGFTINYNDVTFTNSANITAGNTHVHTINNYNLSSGYTYSFTPGTTTPFNVLTGINHVTSGCADLVLIKSLTNGSRANIRKTAAPFNVNGAFISDINSAGATMNVLNGLDGGNNNNVTVASATGRTMYWVNNAGNWSDGTNHWSIGVSGGNPAVTNPSGCIPRVIDSVVFDNHSFSLAAQTVTLDVDGNCKGMLWTTAAGSRNPVFAGASTRLLNNYGSIELGAGMSSTFNGTMIMWSMGTGVNANYLDMNGVNTNNNIEFRGGGRYDLTDSVSIVNGANISQVKGTFNTNGYKIYAGNLSLTPANGNSASIANSLIELTGPFGAYTATHNTTAGSAWDATGSTLRLFNGWVQISNSMPVTYENIDMLARNNNAGNAVIGSATQRVTFNKIKFSNANTTGVYSKLDGIFTIDTLQYTPFSINSLTPGGSKEYLVNDTIIAYGTPCMPTYIRSATVGTPAILKRTICNTFLNFVNIRDITAGSCTAAQNKVLGTDEGGNTNWTFTSIPGLSSLGPDTTLLCKDLPYLQLANGYGSIPGMSYLWNTGAMTGNISIGTGGTYSVTVTYAPGCNVTGSRVITVGPTPPVTMPATYKQQSATYCTTGGYNYYDGAAASATNNKSILALNPNGNTITPSSITVNNEGNLTGGGGIFTNSAPGYYQSTDGVKTIRVSKRLHSVVAPGSYTVNGGVIVRVYYEDADLANIASDTWPGGFSVSEQGWFKHTDNTAQGVVNTMTPGYLTGGAHIVPTASGTQNGVKYVEFKVTSFSTFGYYAKTTPYLLPADITGFTGITQGCAVKLNWRSSVESNLKRFEVQRSADGGNTYTTIQTITATGSGSSYSYTDDNPVAGKNLYRLKMTDADGHYTYSPITLVPVNCNGGTSVVVYPNPAVNTATVSIGGFRGNVTGYMHNAAGQLVMTGRLVNGSNILHIEKLAAGVYSLSVMDENGGRVVTKVTVGLGR